MTSSVTYGLGAITPIPPVLGPFPPSKICLWSFPDKKGIIVFPSVIESIEASTPSRNSSITIVFPAFPNLSSTMHSLTALTASSLFWHIITPFPAANPSALTTVG